MIIAGIDEAGYGPTLGPLVVSVSVFRAPAARPRAGEAAEGAKEAAKEAAIPDLWELLDEAVCRKPDGERIPVEDSKKLFSQKKGLRNLEEGLLPFVELRHGKLPRSLRALLQLVARRGHGQAGGQSEASPDAYLEGYPWYRGRDLELPVDTYLNVITTRALRLRAAMEQAGVELLGLAAWTLDVLELNQRLEEAHNKALVSFEAVGSFLARLWKQFPGEEVEVAVDRQGGRMRYGPLLYERIHPRGIRIEEEREESSVYSLTRGRSAGGGSGSFRVSFATGSEERVLPVGLASMLSKYLRETHMAIFNRYWKEQVTGLRPTAGYSVDARRFLSEIGPHRQRLGIDEAILIRRR